MASPIKIFCCYAHKDQELLIRLKTHLMPLYLRGLIDITSDIDIGPGTEWEREIKQHLDTAQIILLLVSPDFMSSDYCYSTEMKRAIERHESGEAHVIPVILRPTMWEEAPFSKLQALPKDGKPVTGPSWHSEDEAFHYTAEGIAKVVKKLTTQSFITLPEQRKSKRAPVKLTPALGKKAIFIILAALLVIGSASLLTWYAIVTSSHTSSLGSANALHTATLIAPATATARTIAFNDNATAQAQASATAAVIAANPDPYGGGTLALYDPLRDNNSDYGWEVGNDNQGGSCGFTGGTLHVSEAITGHNFLCPVSRDFSNFAFEVQMMIIKGDAGGLVFRVNNAGNKFYSFIVGQDGSYILGLYVNTNGNYSRPLVSGTSSAIHQGLSQTNVIAVVAKGNTITLYANRQQIASVTDSNYSHGQVGVVAYPFNASTEVVYSNAKVWIL